MKTSNNKNDKSLNVRALSKYISQRSKYRCLFRLLRSIGPKYIFLSLSALGRPQVSRRLRRLLERTCVNFCCESNACSEIKSCKVQIRPPTKRPRQPPQARPAVAMTTTTSNNFHSIQRQQIGGRQHNGLSPLNDNQGQCDFISFKCHWVKIST